MAEIPLWGAVLIAFFLIIGSGLTLIGAVGLTIFNEFYDRLHAPTLGTTWGVGSIIIASLLFSSLIAHHLILHALLLTIFLVVTSPVTLMLLSRTAIQRNEIQDWQELLRKNDIQAEKEE